jgi:hypothetical protein
MKLIHALRHLLIPHESNNQKAKLLHPSSLFLVTIGLIAFQLVLTFTNRTFPRVLGYAANISPAEVIRLTNAQRAQGGLTQLTENSALSQAALAKGNDMLAKGYWAHFAPDGTSPWSFFLKFGYKYKFAGENLARDFSDASSAVSAWMNSPTHRENILNANYREIGIGVVEGNLSGVDTTIIVQFFGTSLAGTNTIPEVQAQAATTQSPAATAKPVVKPTVAPTPTPTATPTPIPTPVEVVTNLNNATGSSIAYVSPFSSTKGISLFIIGILLMVLSIDLIIVRRKRIARISGRTMAHIAFLGMILAVILILKAGQII